MTIELDPTQLRFVEEQIQGGKFATVEEVVVAGMELLRAQYEVRARLQHSLDQARRGELLDADEVFDEIERRLS